MSRLRIRGSHLVLVLAVAAGAALGACSKTADAPTGFGVNVTVDAKMLSSAQLMAIDTDKLTVVTDPAGATPVVRVLADLPSAIRGGTVRFHYTPGTGVSAGNKLRFGLDVLHGTTLIASGSAGPVTLAANAVAVTITLTAVGDGGVPPGDGGDAAAGDGGGGDGGNPNGKANGIACVTDDECGSGFCTDGVCCNERCDDVCVSCAATAATKGTCTAYAEGEDPEMECGPVIPMEPDAGTAATSDAGAEGGAEAGAADGGGTGSDGSADGGESDAAVLNTPDGGFMTMPKTCGGSCSGSRSCKYPGTTTSCGTPFCNTSSQAASFVCDGKGGCGPALTECADYKCVGSTGACGSSCTATADCLSTDFCGGDKHCTTKKGNGVPCVTPDECSSGNCIAGPTGGVCCNTACDSPLTCTMAGAVGQCKCAECPNGTCQVFYPDKDGDGYGDRTATYAQHTAVAACTGMPPMGYVADNTDCDDGDVNAHPGQTSFFTTPSAGIHTWDYNCDGDPNEKQTPEYPGGSCKFCGAVGSCSLSSATCGTANQASSFQCPQEYYNPVITKLSEPISTDGPIITRIGGPDGVAPRAAMAAVPVDPIYRFQCCGCLPNDRTGFLGTVACGNKSTTYTCGPCSAAGGGTTSSATAGVTQACH